MTERYVSYGSVTFSSGPLHLQTVLLSKHVYTKFAASDAHCVVQVVKLLQHDRKLVGKYQQKLLESYIEDNKQVKWCPSVPHCGCAIQV